MLKTDFDNYANFTYKEVFDFYVSKGFADENARKEISKIKKSAFDKLQRLRTVIGKKINFNSITEGVHAPNSQHPNGTAFDITIGDPGEAVNWNTICEHAIDVGFKGIGFYPFWNRPGIHVDDRNGKFEMWIRNKSGEYVGFI